MNNANDAEYQAVLTEQSQHIIQSLGPAVDQNVYTSMHDIHLFMMDIYHEAPADVEHEIRIIRALTAALIVSSWSYLQRNADISVIGREVLDVLRGMDHVNDDSTLTLHAYAYQKLLDSYLATDDADIAMQSLAENGQEMDAVENVLTRMLIEAERLGIETEEDATVPIFIDINAALPDRYRAELTLALTQAARNLSVRVAEPADPVPQNPHRPNF